MMKEYSNALDLGVKKAGVSKWEGMEFSLIYGRKMQTHLVFTRVCVRHTVSHVVFLQKFGRLLNYLTVTISHQSNPEI